MKTNAAGITLIKSNEGCELTAYVCPAGRLTIGFGDTGPHVVHGMTITEEEAENLLAARLEREFENGVLRAIGDVPTTRNQFAAMVSLAYNIGVGGFAKSSVARFHREGNYEAAAEAFHLWNRGGGRVLAGLVRRRQEEADLYMTEDNEEDG
jgi:lysozyme